MNHKNNYQNLNQNQQQQYPSNQHDPASYQHQMYQQWPSYGYYPPFQQSQQQQQNYPYVQQQPPPLPVPNYTTAPPPPPPSQPNSNDRNNWNQNHDNRGGGGGGGEGAALGNMRQQNWTRGNNRGRGGNTNFNRNSENNTNRRFNDTSQFGNRNQNENFRFSHEFQQQPPSTSIQQNTVENFSQPPSVTNQNSPQVCDEQDIAFMKQFEEWQTGFEKWREENKNHPDKIQYKKYEDQFLTVRDQLTARRNDMLRKKALQNPVKTVEQKKFESQWIAGNSKSPKQNNFPHESSNNSSIGSNILTVQVPPSNTLMSDSGVAPLLFGPKSTLTTSQEKDFKSDSFDTNTFGSFDDSLSSNFREKMFHRTVSIPGLDVAINEPKIDEDTQEIIDLEKEENAVLENPFERKSIQTDQPNFKPKGERHIIDIENILENPGRLQRAEKILIIIRGAGGSGKSYLANLILNKEQSNGNVRCLIVESRGRGFQAVFGECMDIINVGYINFIILVIERASIQQLLDFEKTVSKVGQYQCFSIEIHQKFEFCLRNNINKRPDYEIRNAIDDLERNTTPMKMSILDPTSLLKSKELMPKISLTSITSSSDSEPPNNTFDYSKILQDGNVLELVKSQMSASQTISTPNVSNTYVTAPSMPPPSMPFNTNNQNQNQLQHQLERMYGSNVFNIDAFQPPPLNNDIDNAMNNIIDDCPLFEPKKVIEYNHIHRPTFDELLLEFKVFRVVDHRHQTTPEIRELLKHVDVDKIIEKRKAVAQRKKILHYLRDAERPEDTVSNPSYPKNWEVISRERPPRKNKRKKIKTAKIKRVLMEKQQTNKNSTQNYSSASKDSKMELDDISSDDNDMDNDDHGATPIATTSKTEEYPKFIEIVSDDEFEEEKDNKNQLKKAFDEFESVTAKSIPDFNHFNHKNVIDIREILWMPSRKNRPRQILIILRGAAGSGKSHLVQLIKRKESELGKASDIRILSIDDYFLTDDDDEEKSLNKSTKDIQNYLEEMLRHLKKTITDGLHNFIMIDAENCDMDFYMKFHQVGNQMGFSVYAIELFQKLEICVQQCCRNVTQEQIQGAISSLERHRIPSTHTLIIPLALYDEYNCFMNSKLLKNTEDVEMDELNDDNESLPSFNWHCRRKSRDIYEILDRKSRFTRPRQIAILLRGPDTRSKIDLASMIIHVEREMRNENIIFVNVEEFFVNPINGKFDIASQNHAEEHMKKLTRQLRDIARGKSFKFVIINVETGDFNHYSQVHELMSSYQYQCYTIELYRSAENCSKNDPYERLPSQFEAVVDQFELHPLPDEHELLNASKFYRNNLSLIKKQVLQNEEKAEKSDKLMPSTSQDAPSKSISIKKLRKLDQKRTFESLKDEFQRKFSRRLMINGEFIPRQPESPSKLPEFNWYNKELIVDIKELLEKPSSLKRAKKIVIFIRGAPGSGKSFLANLIAQKEIENGNRDNLKILSVDNFFEKEAYRECEHLKYEKYIECTLNEKVIVEYMEELSKALENIVYYNENYSFIIIDGDFCELKFYDRMWNIAVNEGGYTGYAIELNQDDNICLNYNIHGWSNELLLSKNQQMREISTSDGHTLLDPEYLYEYKYDLNMLGDIFTVNIEDLNTEDDDEDISDDYDANTKVASKWDNTEVDKFERMDGTKNKSLHHMTMDVFLQMNEWTMRPSNSTGKKRVRWADIEEKKAQEREREIGFIVGQTDWNRILNETDCKSALEKTKYIEPRRKN